MQQSAGETMGWGLAWGLPVSGWGKAGEDSSGDGASSQRSNTGAAGVAGEDTGCQMAEESIYLLAKRGGVVQDLTAQFLGITDLDAAGHNF